jgi:NAD-dependent dihydropyrimidine dehydrogenase PreA subunit
VEACPHDVLDVVKFFFHRHVRVRRREACRGCLKCVTACEHGAIAPVRPRRLGPDAAKP